jgi:hypothetical protein
MPPKIDVLLVVFFPAIIPKKFSDTSSAEGFRKAASKALFGFASVGPAAHKSFVCKAFIISFLVALVNPLTGGLSEY